MRTAHRDGGFTISELVLVLAVFAALVAIAVVSLRGLDEDSATIECRDELRALKAATERFKAELTVYPPDDQALQDAGYLDLADTPNYQVVSTDSGGPTFKPVGDRCR
jgi:prepilin-type N-terminal cleavage/methylation domain-containing protein